MSYYKYEGIIRSASGQKVSNPIKLKPKNGPASYRLTGQEKSYCDEIQVFFGKDCYKFLPEQVIKALKVAKKSANRKYKLITVISIRERHAISVESAIIMPHTACSLYLPYYGDPEFHTEEYRHMTIRAIDGHRINRSLDVWEKPPYASGSYTVLTFANHLSSISPCEISDDENDKHGIEFFHGGGVAAESAANAILRDAMGLDE